MTTYTYEFTAFTEDALLEAGSGNGSNLGYGDSFTMPATADTTFVVTDNDQYLSGDSRRNENSNDRSYQTATITVDGEEAGNGGQVYGEKYFWVWGSSGNWYLMIEIEQERTNDDYFTFYGPYGMPQEGETLTVSCGGNISCWQPNMNYMEGPPVVAPPLAVLDTITITEGESIGDSSDDAQLNILANDFDTDGTISLTEVNGAAPGEVLTVVTEGGVTVDVTVDANGNLSFDSRSAFDALRLEESDTFELTYSITDDDGNVATSTVTVTIEGEESPPDAIDDFITVSASETTGDNDGNVLDNDIDPEGDELTVVEVNGDNELVAQTVAGSNGGTVSINTDGTFDFDAHGEFDNLKRGEAAETTFEYSISDGRADEGVPKQNIVFVVDVSGSTSPAQFDGTSVGDQNGDGVSNSVLDAEIAAFKALSAEIASLGLNADKVDIGLVIFSGNQGSDQSGASEIVGTFKAGSSELEDALNGLTDGGFTNLEAPMQQTVNWFGSVNATTDDNNVVYFLSDGMQNRGGEWEDEVTELENSYDASIVAVGVGNGAVLSELNTVDNTGGAEIVTNTDDLTTALIDGFQYDFTADDTATLTVTVVGENHGPEALNESVTIEEDGSVGTDASDTASLNILANDSDFDGDAVVIETVEGLAAGEEITVVTANNDTVTVTVDASGEISFDTNGALDALIDGQSDSFTLAYTVSDGFGGTADAVVTINIVGVNDLKDGDELGEVAEGSGATALADNALANAIDVDGGTPVVSSLDGQALNGGSASAEGSSGGTFTFDADGNVTFDTAGAFAFLNENQSIETSVTYEVADGQGGTVTSTYVVKVTGSDDDPIIEAINDVYTVLETEGAGDSEGNVLDNDSLPFAASSLVVEVNGAEGAVGEWIDVAGGGRFMLTADGEIDFDAQGAYNALTKDQVASENLTYSVRSSDGQQASLVSIFTGPNGLTAKAEVVELNGELVVTVSVLEEGGDIGDIRGLFFDVSDESLLSGMTATGSDVTGQDFDANNVTNLGGGNNVNGSVLIALGAFDGGITSGTPGIGSDDVRSTTFTLSHSSQALTLDLLSNQDMALRLTSVGEEGGSRGDSLKLGSVALPSSSEALIDSATVQINIVGLNEAPDAVNDVINTDEDNGVNSINIITAVDGNVDPNSTLGEDADPDGPTSALTITKVIVDGVDIVVPDGGSSVFTATDSLGRTVEVTVDSDGNVTVGTPEGFDATDDQDGVFAFEYEITDADGDTDVAQVTINVDDLAEPIAPVAVDDVINTDEDNGVTSVNIITAVDGNVDPNSNLGEDSDPDGPTSALTITKVIVDGADVVVPDGGSAVFTATDTLGRSVEVTVDGAGNVTVGTPEGFDATDDQDGVFTFEYEITDEDGEVDVAQVTINVDDLAEPIAPVAVDDVITTDEDTAVDGLNIITSVDGNDLPTSTLGADSDPDSSTDDLTITQITVGSQVIAVPTTGTTTFTADNVAGQSVDVTIDNQGNISVAKPDGFDPTNDQDGVFSFEYTIVDSDGLEDEATVTINVEDLDEPAAGPEINVVFLLDASDAAVSANNGILNVGDLNGDQLANSHFDVSISVMQEAVNNIKTALGGNAATHDVDIGVFSFESQLPGDAGAVEAAVALTHETETVFDLSTDFGGIISGMTAGGGTPFGDNGSDIVDGGVAFMAAAMDAANGFISNNAASGDAINLVYVLTASTGMDIGNDYFDHSGANPIPGQQDGVSDGFLPVDFLEGLQGIGPLIADLNLEDTALTQELLEAQTLGLSIDTLFFQDSAVATNQGLFALENFIPDANGVTLADNNVNQGSAGKDAFLANITTLVDDLIA